LEYQRSVPTPSGFAQGWDIVLTEKSQDLLLACGTDFSSLQNCCDTTKDVLKEIEAFPNINEDAKRVVLEMWDCIHEFNTELIKSGDQTSVDKISEKFPLWTSKYI